MSFTAAIGNADASRLVWPYEGLWPITEAGAGDKFFVTEFNNPTTGGDETGSGFGLSGADLLVPQYGNVPGAVSGWREIVKESGQRFDPTDAQLAALFQANGFGVLSHRYLVEWDTGDSSYDMDLAAYDDNWNIMIGVGTGASERLSTYIKGGTQSGLGNVSVDDYSGQTSGGKWVIAPGVEFWTVHSYFPANSAGLPYPVLVCGGKAGASQPTSIDDLDGYTYSVVSEEPNFSGITMWSEYNRYVGPISTMPGRLAGSKIKSITLGKIPFGRLA